jgi:hypothetical protein
LQYDRSLNSPDSALVIFRDQQAFDRLNQLGSFKFSIERRPFNPYDLHWIRERQLSQSSSIGLEYMLDELEGKAPNGDHSKDSSASKLKEELKGKRLLTGTRIKSPKTDSKVTVQEFEVKAEPWKGSHRGYLERSTYWGPFQIETSLMQQHLAKIVPLPALSDVKVHRHPMPLPILYRKSRALATAKTLQELYNEGQRAKS